MNAIDGNTPLATAPSMIYEQARDVAVEAAEQAALVIRQYAGQVGQIREKAMHDLVTHVDEESQRIIVKHLLAAFPDHEILAEEGTDTDSLPPNVAEGYRWIIDPIDGTTNFTRGVPPFAVSIGLQHQADMVVGVVLDVSNGDLFTAIKGQGLYFNGRRAEVSKTNTVSSSIITTGFPYRSFGHIDAYLKVLRGFMQQARGVRRPGSASIDMAWIACGRFDGFFETGLNPWDVAAGYLLIEEGGGRVTDFGEGTDAVFGKQVLASNGILHDALLEIVAPLRHRYD